MSEGELKLAVDETLGRLVTWLRALGLDTIYFRPGTSRVQKRLKSKGRVFLTRTRGLTIGRTILVEEDDYRRQLVSVAAGLGLDPDRLRPFTRCLRCNTPLKHLPRDEAAGLVPDYVLSTAPNFDQCPDCGRVYWPGTHLKRMSERIGKLSAELS